MFANQAATKHQRHVVGGGERPKSVATVVQMSLLLMSYTRAHFSSNEILNGVMRTSSPLCVAEVCKVMDLNGNSLLVLMKHEKHSQFTQGEGKWEGGGGGDERGRHICCHVCVKFASERKMLFLIYL